MSNAIVSANQLPEDEHALAAIAATTGDLSLLDDEQRAKLYGAVCRSMGLNPLTQPFGYIKTQNGLKLYALKGGTEQIRSIQKISLGKPDIIMQPDSITVSVSATMPDGRTDYDIGVVSIKGLQGENLSNAIMKAITKAKRRVTLSIAGLGWLDESEVQDAGIPTVQVNTATGRIHNEPQRAPVHGLPAPVVQHINDVREAREEQRKEAEAERGPGSFTPPTPEFWYDESAEEAPDERRRIVTNYIMALNDAGMKDETYRHAIAWAHGYDGSTRNVPTEELVKWTRGIKRHPDHWKRTAEMRMVDMQSQQEQLAFEQSREYTDVDEDGEIHDIDPENDTYEGQYEEVEEA